MGAGGVPPAFMRGHSLLPLMSINTDSGKAPQTTYPTDRHVSAQYHSNMGNTGSFMLRWRQWKYIAFGTNLPAFESYKPQLFNVDADPDEQHDVAATETSVAAALEAKLRSVYGDYNAIDKECKANDFMIYKTFFMDKFGNFMLKKKFRGAYTGFNHTDWEKIQ